MNTFIACQEKGDLFNQLLSENAQPKNIIKDLKAEFFIQYAWINSLQNLNKYFSGAWVAQLVERPTLDFDSGYDLRVMR